MTWLADYLTKAIGHMVRECIKTFDNVSSDFDALKNLKIRDYLNERIIQMEMSLKG